MQRMDSLWRGDMLWQNLLAWNSVTFWENMRQRTEEVEGWQEDFGCFLFLILQKGKATLSEGHQWVTQNIPTEQLPPALPTSVPPYGQKCPKLEGSNQASCYTDQGLPAIRDWQVVRWMVGVHFRRNSRGLVLSYFWEHWWCSCRPVRWGRRHCPEWPIGEVIKNWCILE